MKGLVEFLEARIADDESTALYGETPHTGPGSMSRVLAEVDGKRRIIGAWRLESRGDETVPQRTPVAGALLYVIKVHATSYADHPDYLEEWRP